MKSNNTAWAALLVGAACCSVFTPNARAQSSEALMDALVRKGILTEQEAEDIKSDLVKENRTVNKVIAPGKTTTALSFSGDVRGRYESFSYENAAGVDRHRFRYRLRAGVTASLTDSFEAGFRLGSGDLDNAAELSSGTDPISNNQTFQNNASKKGVFLDLVYGKWTPLKDDEWLTSITVGKMQNPFVFSDLVFDGDYTPEGAALQIGYALNDQHNLQLNSGVFVLDEIGGDSNDPYLAGVQLRLESAWSDHWSSSGGVGILAIANEEALGGNVVQVLTPTGTNNVINWTVPNSNRGNTRSSTASGAQLQNTFNPLVADAAVTHTLESAPFYPGAFPIKLAGDFIHNPGADDNENGWSAGITFGKAGKQGAWEVGYRYKYLEADAWYEELVDSDFGAYYQSAPPGGSSGYQAGTNVKGHILKAAYSPYNALTVGVTALFTELINENPVGSDSAATRLQFDAALKF